jgi:hypothetical protein
MDLLIGKDYRWGLFLPFRMVLQRRFHGKRNRFTKLRGGWGKLGNQNVPLNNQAYSSGLNYLGGSICMRNYYQFKLILAYHGK